MSLPFALRLAAREGRATVRRLGAYTVAIAVGIAALVAINSFRAQLLQSVEDESRTLLGADLRISSGRPLPDSVQAVLDSTTAAGVPLATVTSTVSVALSSAGLTRLVQVRGVEGPYPFYGAIETNPAGLWGALGDSHDALVDPALLLAVEARVGDTLRIGLSAFRIAGTLTKGPVELGPQSLIAPRVYIARQWLGEAGLIQFGSLVTYEAFLRIEDAEELQGFGDRYHSFFERQQVNETTAEEQSEQIGEGLEWMTRFLGLVGLTALLLGGLGVASSVNVFVKQKRRTIATLRCLGATPRTAFLAYLLQAALLGLIGSLAGVLLGLIVQALLPAVLGPLLPVSVRFRVDVPQILGGLLIGVWVATVFALLPLLEVRSVSPLQALRQDVEPEPARRDPLQWLVALAVIGSVALLAVMQAPMIRIGLLYTGALLVGLGALRSVAGLLMKATRRWFPHRASFVVRQGVGSLFRPANQTAAVIVALGFGVYLIAANWTVQRNLLDTIQPRAAGDQPNLVAFDIQPDQTGPLGRVFAAAGLEPPELVPIVPARIVSLRGRDADAILNSTEAREIEPWALRREHRNTFRARLTGTEELIEGEWWDESQAPPLPADTGASRPVRVSVEEDIAKALDIRLGDAITWDIQGIRLESRVTSFRRVDWARLETNFFFVFEPGRIGDVPATYVTLARVPDPDRRAALQRDIARALPNVSTIDVAVVQETITRVIRRVAWAIRFIAVFVLVGGIVVLAGAIAAGRFQRARESALLRTLGATSRQASRILLTEYAALGSLAGLTGVALGSTAAWAMTRWVFEVPFRLPFLALATLWLGVAGLATLIGTLSSRGMLRRPPLAALREAGE